MKNRLQEMFGASFDVFLTVYRAYRFKQLGERKRDKRRIKIQVRNLLNEKCCVKTPLPVTHTQTVKKFVVKLKKLFFKNYTYGYRVLSTSCTWYIYILK